MAAGQATTPNTVKDWQKILRAFHLTGRAGELESELLRGQPLWPAVASKLVTEHRLAAQYPLILPSPPEVTDGNQPICLLDALAVPQLDEGNGTGDNREYPELERIVSAAQSIIAESSTKGISEVVAEAQQKISAENENAGSLPDLPDLISRLPESGRLIGFGQETLSLCYSWAVAAERNDQETRFRAEIEELVRGLEVELSQREQEQDPESLAKLMGEEGNIFVDLEKLAQNLPQTSVGDHHLEERLQLIRETQNVLRDFLGTPSQSVPVFLISSGNGPKFSELPADAKIITSNCYESGLQFIDEQLQRMSRVFRAARIARLLVAGRYQPELHNQVFTRFEWQSCNQQEIQLIPKVLVVDSAAGLTSRGDLAALCRLLRSGRPIQVLITLDESELSGEELGGALEDLGAIALAAREAFVLQSTLAQPDHLLAGLREMVRTVRPAIGFVSCHATSQPIDSGWNSEQLAHHGRCAPCFRYAPDRGLSWSERLDISGNPQVDQGQPVISLGSCGLPEAANRIDESVTFAHAAAVRPEFRNHFCVIPDDAWNDDQQPIGTYLEEFKSTPPASLPYIWVVNELKLRRVIITREMANACRDRYLAWRSLQELAGMGRTATNENARREEIQPELEQAPNQSEMEKARALGREEGTVHAVNRIVEALLGPKA